MPLPTVPFLTASTLALLLMAGVPGNVSAQAPTRDNSRFVEVPGGRLWVESQGSGAPLVLLHDGLLPSETWEAQVPAFSRSFRTIRYDRRGFGRSEPPQGPYSDVADLAAVLDALQLERAVLVGCSNGSRIAVDFVLAHPDRVEALVLAGPVVGGRPFSAHFRQRNLVNSIPFYREKNVEKLIDAWVRDPYLMDPANTRPRERLRELLTRYPGPVQGTLPLGRREVPPAAGRLGEIRVPTLLVAGAADIPDVHAHMGALEAGIKGARRVVLAGAGHLVHMEIPERFNQTVLGFLRPGDAAAAWLRTLEGDRTAEEHPNLLSYDASAPLGVIEAGSEDRGEARVIDLSYASPLGGRVPAFLVLPRSAGSSVERHPAVLFVHPASGDRSTFLDEAAELAGRGIASLLMGAPHTRGIEEAGDMMDPEGNYQEWLQLMIDVRRGFDLLASRPEIDPRRIAFVGHSLGATPAGTIAAHDPRPVAWVLMAGWVSLTHSLQHNTGNAGMTWQTLSTPEQQRAFVERLGPLDSIHWIGRAKGKILFQFGRWDETTSAEEAEAFIQATPEPKEVRWYDTGHFFDAQARKDRVEWLVGTLSAAAGTGRGPW